MGVEPVESALVFGEEHVEVGVEDGFGDKLEILVFDSSLIGSFLTNKRYFHGALQILFDFSKFFHRIIKDVISVDIEIQENEPIEGKLMIVVNFLNNIVEAALHIFSDIQLLLVNRLKLYDPVFILKTEKEGIVDKIEFRFFVQHQFVLFNWIDGLHNDFVIEMTDGDANFVFIAQVHIFHHIADQIDLRHEMFESLFRRFFEVVGNHFAEDEVEVLNYEFEVGLVDVVETADQNLVVVF